MIFQSSMKENTWRISDKIETKVLTDKIVIQTVYILRRKI
jgi:hypothetical protein